jgi:hypothetical protein
MAGGAFMGLVSFVLTLSFAVLKIALFVVLPIWLVFAIAPRIARWFKGGGNGGGESKPSTPPNPASESGSDFDPE